MYIFNRTVLFENRASFIEIKIQTMIILKWKGAFHYLVIVGVSLSLNPRHVSSAEKAREYDET